MQKKRKRRRKKPWLLAPSPQIVYSSSRFQRFWKFTLLPLSSYFHQ
jgi:hypothetical protein